MAKTLQIDGLIMRHDTWENWTADGADVLLEGELGFVVDDSDHNGEMRIGGVGGTTWLNSKILNQGDYPHWVGTKEEYEAAVRSGDIPDGCIVIITDDSGEGGGGEPVDLSEYTKTVDLPTTALDFYTFIEEYIYGARPYPIYEGKQFMINSDGSCDGKLYNQTGRLSLTLYASPGTKMWFGYEVTGSEGFNWTITDYRGNGLIHYDASDPEKHRTEETCVVAPVSAYKIYINIGDLGWYGNDYKVSFKFPVKETLDRMRNRIPGIATEETYGTIRGSSSYGYGFVANNGAPYAKTVTKAQYATSSQNMFISKGTLDNIKEDFGSGDMLKSEYATNGTTGVVDKAVADKDGNDIVETYVSTDEIGTEIDSVGINADTLGGFAADEFVRVGDAGVSVEEVEEINAGSLAGFPANTFAQVEFYDTSDMVTVPVNADTLEGHRANEFVTHTEIEESKEYILPETVIGKWYDGKPIYRKIIVTKTPSAAGANKVAEIRNLGTVINLSGFVQRPEGVQQIPVNFYFSGDYRTAIYFQGNDIMMINTGYGNMDVTFIIEYTKTTD